MGEKETAAGDEAGLIKTKTKSNQSNDIVGDEGSTEAARASGPRQANQGFREGGISHEDDWDGHAGKLAPDKPGKSEIAIGDPGVNGNITGEPSGIAVTDEGVPAAKQPPQSH